MVLGLSMTWLANQGEADQGHRFKEQVNQLESPKRQETKWAQECKGSQHGEKDSNKQIKIYMSNVTSWSKMTESYCGHDFEHDIIFISEHRHTSFV